MQYEEQEEKRMSFRQANLLTIEMCWRHFIPYEAVPSIFFRCNWLNLVENRLEIVLDVIEKAARRIDSGYEVNTSVEQYVWRLLKAFDARTQALDKARHNDARPSQRFVVSTPASA